MSYKHEFATVDLILASVTETRGVDAFALSLIKCERQFRRLVTHLVFQFPCFRFEDIKALRTALGSNRKVYFEGFVRGFDALYPRHVRDLVGKNYDRLYMRLEEAIEFRNKIFHGQLTSKWLSRDDLVGYVSDIRTWCQVLAESLTTEIGYDGFARDSFRKSEQPELWKRLKIEFKNVDDYSQFIIQNMQRPQQS